MTADHTSLFRIPEKLICSLPLPTCSVLVGIRLQHLRTHRQLLLELESDSLQLSVEDDKLWFNFFRASFSTVGSALNADL